MTVQDIASPYRGEAIDNPPKITDLKGGVSIAGLLARCHPQVGYRYGVVADDARIAALVQRGALEARETAKLDTEDAKRNLLNKRAAIEASPGFTVQPNSAIAIELAADEDAEKRAEGRESETAKKLGEASANYSGKFDFAEAVRDFIAARKHAAALQIIAVVVEYGEDILGTIAAKSIELAERRRRRGAVKRALPPADSRKRQARNLVATVADRAIVELTGIHDPSGRIGFRLPTIALTTVKQTSAGDIPRVVDMEAMACRFWGDQIIAELEAEIDATYAELEPDEVLDPNEKRTLLAALDREIDQLERELAELIWIARESGHAVDFPADLPPQAILGVA